ncbi:phosphoenolpyruvate carboxykinase (GTP) [Candidatus Peregrinibacteria bacterium]|nr:phosphoenolpyruvate carboxykinase (GTP) [Candidatus Peregrinibacteria bacterium]
MNNFAQLPGDCTLLYNPSFEQLDEMIAAMPNAQKTKHGNWNVSTRVTSRSAPSTFVITETPEKHSMKTITPEEGKKIAEKQNKYMQGKTMIVIDGFIGDDPSFRTKARLIVEQSSANIAAMQKTMYYTPPDYKNEDYEPEVTVIMTPGLDMPDYPDNRVITVDLENNVTRVCNSDYFGESKKGGLRMWNNIVYKRGGLALHAGGKIIPTREGDKTILIIGLSGTGKTTTTFTNQNNSQPVQDDFVALMPDGKVYASEAGCFAKTFGLNPETEAVIHGATISKNAYLENVSQNEDGELDFFDTSYTKNGRAVFSLKAIENAASAQEINKADALIILNRNENVIPAITHLSGSQAAAYFMLGETTGTSAGGASEEGKALRVPGTNPFFPLLDDFQGNRLKDLLGTIDMEVFMMNTGSIGGAPSNDFSKKIKIPHSSSIVKGIAENTIQWEKDMDFGYEVATHVPDITDEELLQPKKLYNRTDRIQEYEVNIKRLKRERAHFFKQYPQLETDIVEIFNN